MTETIGHSRNWQVEHFLEYSFKVIFNDGGSSVTNRHRNSLHRRKRPFYLQKGQKRREKKKCRNDTQWKKKEQQDKIYRKLSRYEQKLKKLFSLKTRAKNSKRRKQMLRQRIEPMWSYFWEHLVDNKSNLWLDNTWEDTTNDN